MSVMPSIDAIRQLMRAHSYQQAEEMIQLLLDEGEHDVQLFIALARCLLAQESFEEALLMGTEGQRRQALEGITKVGELKAQLGPLTATLKKAFKSIFGKRGSLPFGLSLVSDEENLVLVSEEAIQSLPARLVTGKRITALPPRFADMELPLSARGCIAYTDDEDVRYIVTVAQTLAEMGGTS